MKKLLLALCSLGIGIVSSSSLVTSCIKKISGDDLLKYKGVLIGLEGSTPNDLSGIYGTIANIKSAIAFQLNIDPREDLDSNGIVIRASDSDNPKYARIITDTASVVATGFYFVTMTASQNSTILKPGSHVSRRLLTLDDKKYDLSDIKRPLIANAGNSSHVINDELNSSILLQLRSRMGLKNAIDKDKDFVEFDKDPPFVFSDYDKLINSSGVVSKNFLKANEKSTIFSGKTKLKALFNYDVDQFPLQERTVTGTNLESGTTSLSDTDVTNITNELKQLISANMNTEINKLSIEEGTIAINPEDIVLADGGTNPISSGATVSTSVTTFDMKLSLGPETNPRIVRTLETDYVVQIQITVNS